MELQPQTPRPQVQQLPPLKDEPFPAADAVVDEPILADDVRTVPIDSEDKETRLLAQSAIAHQLASATNQDLIDAWLEIRSRPTVSGEQQFSVAMSELFAARKQAQRDIASELILGDGDPDNVLGVGEALAESEDEIDELSSTRLGQYKAYVSANSVTGALSPENQERMANSLFFLDEVDKIVADMTTLEFLGSLALEVVISPKFLFDNFQVFGEINPLEAEKALRNMVLGFSRLEPDEQRVMFPMLKKEIIDALPKARAAQLLLALADPTKIEDVALDFGPLAILESIAVFAGFGSAVIKARSKLKVLKQLAEMGRKDEAGKINAAGLADETGTINKAVGQDKLTAENNATPFKTDDYDPSADNSLSGSSQQAIALFRQRARETARDIDDAATGLPEGLLNPAETGVAIERIDNLFATHLTSLIDEPKIVEAGIPDPFTTLLRTEKTVTGRGVRYDFILADETGTRTLHSFSESFNIDDIGKWTAIRRSLFSGIASPRRLSIGTDLEQDVKAALRLDYTGVAVQTDLRKLLVDAGKGVKKVRGGASRRERLTAIDEILLEGDNKGIQYSVTELRAGVGGHRLDEAQIEAYYNYREIFDSMFMLRNRVARRDMDGRGMRAVGGLDDTGSIRIGIGFGKPAVDADAARALLRSRQGITEVAVLDSKVVHRVRDLEIDELYAQGYRLMDMNDTVLIGRQRFRTLMVRGDQIADLPTTVLRYRRGYVPKFNPKGNYFVQAFLKTSVDGTLGVRRSVLRGFDNKVDAETFALSERNLIASGEHGKIQLGQLDQGPESIRVIRDGDLEALRAGDSGMASTEGLIYGPRKEGGVPFGLDGSTTARAGAFESLTMYLENTKNFATRNEWRMGMAKRWENSVLGATGIRMKFGEVDDTFRRQHKDLTRWHDRIAEWAGWENKSETWWDSLTLGAYEWATKSKFLGAESRVTNYLQTVRQKDPLAAIRSATFHSLLGMYNPIQFLVQAQGAVVAAAVLGNPVKIGKTLGQVHMLTALQHMNDSPEGFAKMVKAFGGNVDEWRATKELWDKTGLYNSVLSNADVDAAIAGWSVTGSAVRNFFNSGLFFFRQGELFNRRFSFLTALGEAGGIKAMSTLTKQKDVLSRASDLMLNLQRANRAEWQKGVLSVPTQFMQITTKTMESLFFANRILNNDKGKLFSDRMRVLLMQAGLYGSAGVFFGPIFARNMLAMAGIQQNEVDKDTWENYVIGINGGLWDLMLQTGLGLDVTFAERGSLVNGFDQTIVSTMFEPNVLPLLFAGPSGAIPERLWFTFKQKVWPLMSELELPDTYSDDPDLAEPELWETMVFMAKETGGLIASPFSTANQIKKAWIMEDLDLLLSRRSDIVARGPFDTMTKVATLIGLKPTAERRVASLRQVNRAQDEYIEMRADQIMYVNTLIMRELESSTPDDARLRYLRRRRKGIEFMIPNGALRVRVMQQVQRRVLDGKSQQEREARKFILNRAEELADAWSLPPANAIGETQQIIRSRTKK